MKKPITFKKQICAIAFLLIVPQLMIIAQDRTRTSDVSYPDLVTFSSSQSSINGLVYEVLPGNPVIKDSVNCPPMPGPFSDNLFTTTGSYSLTVADIDSVDFMNSQDSVVSVNILFTGNNGTQYKIDKINIMHVPDTMAMHPMGGGVGLNVSMHGNTMIGNPCMPKLMSYITLWGLCDLKEATTDTVIAAMRMIHIMVTTNARDEFFSLITSQDIDSTDYNFKNIHTHIILPPLDPMGNMDPIPGTDHGFLHMMWEKVIMSSPSRDWTLAFDILPGPAAINPLMNPTPFSNKIMINAGSYSLSVLDADTAGSSKDSVLDFTFSFTRLNGETYSINGISPLNMPQFFGGVGLDILMHGNTGIETNLMPKLTSYILVNGLVDLNDGKGNLIAANRPIHIMISSRARTEDLHLITSVDVDSTDYSSNMVEAHIMLPAMDGNGDPDPIPGVPQGYLHFMFEKVNLGSIVTSVEENSVSSNSYYLYQNYPNPSQNSTVIKYKLPKAGFVELEVVNLIGKKVKTLVAEKQNAGIYEFTLDANDMQGIYFYRLKAGEFSATKRMIWVK